MPATLRGLRQEGKKPTPAEKTSLTHVPQWELRSHIWARKPRGSTEASAAVPSRCPLGREQHGALRVPGRAARPDMEPKDWVITQSDELLNRPQNLVSREFQD